MFNINNSSYHLFFKNMLRFNQYNRKILKNIICVPYWEFMLMKRFKHQHNMKKWYQTLEVAEDCEDETLRLAFVYQAKRFHPDSGTSEANATKFSEHTAPQHRHYLVYNVGIGTHSKRQKLYTMERAQKAVDSVLEHRLKKLQTEERNTLVGMDKQHAKNIKTRFGMDRLVEDLIQEAMNRGEFKDLPGMGKPLKENTNTRNPYVDFVTYKLNEILIENGFTPEWIQLSKEIREEIQDLRKKLINARSKVGHIPLNYKDEKTWKNIVENFKSKTKEINIKVDKYNLLVPILQKQMLHVKLEDLAKEALSTPAQETLKEKVNSDISVERKNNLLTEMISSIFNK